jgi:hypothetical protein
MENGQVQVKKEAIKKSEPLCKEALDYVKSRVHAGM